MRLSGLLANLLDSALVFILSGKAVTVSTPNFGHSCPMVTVETGMAHTFKGIMIDLRGGKGTVVRGMSRDDSSSDGQREGTGESEKKAKAVVQEK